MNFITTFPADAIVTEKCRAAHATISINTRLFTFHAMMAHASHTGQSTSCIAFDAFSTLNDAQEAAGKEMTIPSSKLSAMPAA